MHAKNCPQCKIAWEEDETIYEFFLKKYEGDTIKAAETASCYGCTPDTPKHFSKNVIGVEISEKYDGVSYWECSNCKSIFDRWTMKLVDKY